MIQIRKLCSLNYYYSFRVLLHLIKQIRCPGHPSGASVYPQGAKCHVRCRRGFRLEGAHTRHCVGDGHWNGEEPICLREVATDPLYNQSITQFHSPSGCREKWLRASRSSRLRDLGGKLIKMFIQ